MTDQERIPLSRSIRDHLEVDDVTPAKYKLALERLGNFLETDVNEIHDLEQLLLHAFSVDHSLRSVLIAKGEFRTVYFDRRKHTGYVIDAVVRETERVYVSSNNITTGISGSTGVNVANEERKYTYMVTIPSGTYSELIANPHAHVLGAFAIDCRGSKGVSYYITDQSADSLIWQGYARILQEAVGDVVSVLPEPGKSSSWLVADEHPRF